MFSLCITMSPFQFNISSLLFLGVLAFPLLSEALFCPPLSGALHYFMLSGAFITFLCRPDNLDNGLTFF